MAIDDLTFVDTGFPDPFNGDVQDLVDAFVANLAASVNSTNYILGQVGGSAPLTDIGPWLDGDTWKVFVTSAYVPATLKLTSGSFTTTFSSQTLTANREVQFQDKAGIVAMTSDVYAGRGTHVVTGTSAVLDWSLFSSFFQSITANTTVILNSTLPGQTVTYLVSATGAFTLFFAAGVQWAGGAQPVQTSTGVDLYEFHNSAGTIYARRIAANLS